MWAARSGAGSHPGTAGGAATGPGPGYQPVLRVRRIVRMAGAKADGQRTGLFADDSLVTGPSYLAPAAAPATAEPAVAAKPAGGSAKVYFAGKLDFTNSIFYLLSTSYQVYSLLVIPLLCVPIPRFPALPPAPPCGLPTPTVCPGPVGVVRVARPQ